MHVRVAAFSLLNVQKGKKMYNVEITNIRVGIVHGEKNIYGYNETISYSVLNRINEYKEVFPWQKN